MRPSPAVNDFSEESTTADRTEKPYPTDALSAATNHIDTDEILDTFCNKPMINNKHINNKLFKLNVKPQDLPKDQYGIGAGRPINSVYCCTTESGDGPAKKYKSIIPPITLKVILSPV